ncbi:MAG TPA: hypothetical protein VHE12_05970 [bacterium]|nr:hypothetical protein [bacterium]
MTASIHTFTPTARMTVDLPDYEITLNSGCRYRLGLNIFVHKDYPTARIPAVVMMTQNPDEPFSLKDVGQVAAAHIWAKWFLVQGYGRIDPNEVLWIERFPAQRESRYEQMDQVSYDIARLSAVDLNKKRYVHSLEISNPRWHRITYERIEQAFGLTAAQMGLPERTRYVD